MADISALEPFVPRLALTWLRETPDARWCAVEGSLAFVDISGFTALTERLARKGKVGAEEMSDILNATFADLLTVAYSEGAGLVKWGGDAMLLLFDGERHADRAARAALRMRDRLARIGRIGAGSGRVVLRMSTGIHSGTFHFFLVGDPAIHRELIVAGPAATRTAELESVAEADQVAVSEQTAALLDPAVLGPPVPGGFLLADLPPGQPGEVMPRPSAEDLDIVGLIPPRIRAHLQSGEGEPEHRRIAVAFVKFAGTDALLDAGGPEALADALDECVRRVQAATEANGVTFFESDIDQDGGKIMLTAGAPSSAGRDEERMLRAARAIVAVPMALAVRVGVNRGPVFAGDFGPPFRRTFSVKGDAVNLAARLLGKAAPGQVVATTAVLERSATTFAIEPLAPFTVKGKSEQVLAAVVGDRVGDPEVTSSEGASGGRSAGSGLVGREAELAELRALTSAAESGAGGLVVVAGEPGIGKSRLVAEVSGEWRGRTVTMRCDEYESATPYWPFRALLRRVLGIAHDASGDVTAAALRERATGVAPDLVDLLPLVAAVADAPLPTTPAVEALADEFRRERTEAVTVQLLSALLDAPTLIVVDDAHLADDASAALLRAMVAGAVDRPWAMLMTRRDVPTGFIPGEGDRVLRPAPLTDAAALALVRGELAGMPITTADAESLISRAGGNPLFLRGLVQAVRDGSSPNTLPETVEALVTAQIDQLPPDERTLLRVASVWGVGFDEEEVRHLLDGRRHAASPEALSNLTFFVRPEGAGRYRFDHQLIRDTAYEGLPFRLRRELHGRAADLVEASAADPADVAELLSLHFVSAGRDEPAWHYSRIAGERAAAKLAFADAEQFLARAVTVARRLRSITPRERAAAQVALGEARRRVGRGEAAIAAFRSAREQVRDDPLETAAILSREASVQQRLGRYTASLRTAGRGLALLEGRGDAPSHRQRSELEMLCSGARAHQGRHREALRWARRAEADAAASRDPEVRAHAAAMIHLSLMMLGTPDRASGELALRMYEEAGDRLRQSEVLNNLALESWNRGDGAEALEDFRRAHALAAESGDAFQAAVTAMNVGDVLMRLGRLPEAEAALEESLHELRAVGSETFEATALRGLGLVVAQLGRGEEGLAHIARAREVQVRLEEDDQVAESDAAAAFALLVAGRTEEALAASGDAVAACEAADADYLLPFILRVRGAALAACGRGEEAVAVLRRALEEAAEEDAERGFILAELAAVAPDAGERRALRDQAGAAWDRLGFAGTPPYPRD